MECEMQWNYRIIRDKNGVYTIGEVFYNPDNTIWGLTTKHYARGNTVQELMENLSMISKDIERSKDDVIDETTIKFTKNVLDNDMFDLEHRFSTMTEEEIDEYCLRDELACMDHPEFDFVKELYG